MFRPRWSLFLILLSIPEVLSDVVEARWDAGGDFSLARTPTRSPPDVEIGRSNPCASSKFKMSKL